MIEETVGGRLAKTLDFFGVVCDLDCSDIPRPEPPDSCRLITSSLLPKKQAQRMAGEGCAIVCSKIVNSRIPGDIVFGIVRVYF